MANKISSEELNNMIANLSSNGYEIAAEFITKVNDSHNDNLISFLVDISDDDLLKDVVILYYEFLFANSAEIEWYQFASLLFEEKCSRNEEIFFNLIEPLKMYFVKGLSIDDLKDLDDNSVNVEDFYNDLKSVINAGNEEDEIQEQGSDNKNIKENDNKKEYSARDDFINYLKNDIARLTEKLESSEAEKIEFSGKLQNAVTALIELQEEYDRYKEKHNSSIVSAKYLEKKLESSEEVVKKLNIINDRLLKARNDNPELKNELELLKNNIKEKEIVIASLQAELSEAKNEINELQNKINDMSSYGTEYVNEVNVPVNDFSNIEDGSDSISHSLADEIDSNNNEFDDADYDKSEVINIEIPSLYEKIKKSASKLGGFMAKIYENKFSKQSEPEQRALIMGKVIAAKYSNNVVPFVTDYLNKNKENSKVELYKLLLKQVPEEEIIDFCKIAS